jgi:hypothetical protein
MNNLTIKTVRSVTCDFSADQWELFTHSFPRCEIEEVANQLNAYLTKLVNSNYDLRQTEDLMHHKMKSFAIYGAYDSEPLRFLELVIEEIYK